MKFLGISIWSAGFVLVLFVLYAALMPDENIPASESSRKLGFLFAMGWICINLFMIFLFMR